MSDMDIVITDKVFLDVCKSIEGLCADLYHYYSKIYSENPEASRLWKKTALEEENHQKQFELALSLLNETKFEVAEGSLKRAYVIQYRLIKHLEQVKNNKPDLLTAVSKAVEMEEKLADLHVQSSLHFKDVSMQNLFKALSNADHDHVEDIQRYMAVLNSTQC